ncbi:YggT family protein [Faucicola atlantae]|uniref:YGGT family n=1 Tax=Faucicola atlantae TaxID=34059 RepID=A0A1B8QBL9_9GAMM|nr:YggT family protein [Moraxella atlantae]OBX77144.1 hypothetical protein A9306_09865 [Moraxella atlantae]
MTSIIAGLFDIVVGSVMLLLFVRFMLQFAEVETKQPFARVIYRITHVVDVFGRIFPTWLDGKINTAALALMALLRLIYIWGVLQMLNLDSQYIGWFQMNDFNLKMVEHLHRYFSPFMLVFVTLMTLVLDFLRMCRYLIIASFLVSWAVFFSNKMPPAFTMIEQLSQPIIAPFRKLLPATGMLDFAPMIGFFAITLLELVVQTMAVYLLTLT